MNQYREVPDWYRFQCRLMLRKPTRELLYNYHRIKKKCYKIKERLLLKHQISNLRNFESKVFSQNGEDGILVEIFRRIGITNKIFAEFWVQDGTECCTRNLLENAGWSGMWIDSSSQYVDKARRMFSHLPINVIESFLTAENIVPLFRDAGLPEEFDLMVIDVDGNDYWMWHALADHFRPRVVVTEFNGTFGPEEEWIIPYDSSHLYDGTAYFGASLASFVKFAHRHGYSLVGCDSMGVNAFFIRDNEAKGRFEGIEEPPSYHYVAPYYDIFWGHPVCNYEK